MMENIRFLLYPAFIGTAFLILTSIKLFLPAKEYIPPVDEIGMKLYRPIFFGESTKRPVVKNKIKEDSEDTLPVKVAVEEPKVEIEKPKVEIEKPKIIVEKPKRDLASEADESYFLDMIEDYKANVLTERKYRNDVVVRYYRHESDGDKAGLLVDFGFYLHVRPVNKERYKTVSSNVIYYGHEFPEQDLKLIAYLLVKNGIPIKRLQPFKDYDGWKKKSLEIGGNAKLMNKPTLTFSQIQAYSVRP